MPHGTTYTRFTPEELDLLVAPGNEEVQDDWLSALELLDGLVAPFSDTHPLPLYLDEERDPALVEESIEKLRGTRFHQRMKENAEAAREIQDMWERHGHTDELRAAADAYLNELDLDYVAVTRHPESAPPLPTQQMEGSQPRRRMAGGR
ncbi:MAG TPA: hypothetical protein VF746_23595 [Longimicrobium sp.]|jgi:hypothetical protein